MMLVGQDQVHNVNQYILRVYTTYQRAMTLIFHDMIHKIVKDYVDDILANSKKRSEHIEVLGPIFSRLKEYKVRLNLKKVCLWGHIRKASWLYCITKRDRNWYSKNEIHPRHGTTTNIEVNERVTRKVVVH